MVPEDSGPLLLVPRSLQDLGVEVQQQVGLSSLDNFLGMFEHIDHGKQDQGESSDAKMIMIVYLDPDIVPSTL